MWKEIGAIEFLKLSIQVMWLSGIWICGRYLSVVQVWSGHFNTPRAFTSKSWAALDFEQVPGITDLGLVPRRVKKVAVLGGGLMGSGIATALVLSNYPVILKEVNNQFLQAGIGRVRGGAWDQLLILSSCNLALLWFYLMKFYGCDKLFFFHAANLQSRVKKGRMTQEKFEKTMSLLKGALDYESFKDVDMVIEVYLFIWFNSLLVPLNFISWN